MMVTYSRQPLCGWKLWS
uniref:Uncharacterized protein n=1 Tax=Arundo donax TaxID=35708 RepID=A0A0A8YL24_ARUDO